eukprot:m.41273 g.41273  ORF g.41273 m.41273 type:complete len:280 (+) comp10538_c0_seq2:541-1380(+)
MFRHITSAAGRVASACRPFTRTQSVAAQSYRTLCQTTRATRAVQLHTAWPVRAASTAAKGPSGGPVSWIGMTLMLAAGGGGVWYFVQKRDEKMAAKERQKKMRGVGRPALGGPFELVDTAGNKVTDTDFLGSWVLLYFGFTFCPDVCPEELEKMSETLDTLEKQVGPDAVKLVFVSVDPDRDTPEKVEKYVKQFHPKMQGLIGTHEQIKDMCKQYRVYYSRPEPDGSDDYLVDHSIIQYLLAPNGDFVAYYGQNSTSPQAAKSIMEHMAFYAEEHPDGN